MKTFIKLCTFIFAMFCTTQVLAAITENICPYVGADYRQIWIKGRGFWSNRVAKSLPGGTLYVGAKFTENFGIEAGYNWSVHKAHVSNVTFGSPGIVTATASVISNFGTIHTRTRFNSFYVDLNGYVPLDNCWELIGTIGLGSMKPKLNVTVVNFGTLTGAQVTALQTISGSARAVWRVGVGAQYLFTETVGARFLVRYEGTDGLRVHNNNFNAFGIGNKAFKDIVSAQLGIYVRF